jgi:flagellar motor switch protein FliN/FliY
MGDMLSQAEIDALLNGTPTDQSSQDNSLSPQEIDALGEIGNISMGTSATTLFTLLGHKVTITTPRVSVCKWDEVANEYADSLVGVKVEYTSGLIGTNFLIMKENDVKVITDLMMGGDGSNTEGALSELHLSAIGEAMNQMVGSSSTSMSSMFDRRIDISPPKAFVFDIDSFRQNIGVDENEDVVKVAFKMVVGDLIDSEIMQILPLGFAREMVESLLNMEVEDNQTTPPPPVEPSRQSIPEPPPLQMPSQPQSVQQQVPDAQNYQRDYGYEAPEHRVLREPVNVSPAHFQSFEEGRITLDRKNINLIMDVPLQVTVELGRTEKLIKDILEFSPGSIIELDKLAGEPVDILVNGKAIAKGEVVVIDESFGVRVTDIIHPSKRL